MTQIKREPAERQITCTASEFEQLMARERTATADVPIGDTGARPRTLDGIFRMANGYMNAGVVPKGLQGANAKETLARVAVALEMGASVGLSCGQSMASIMVVNGRPCLWGDAPMAIVRRSKSCGPIEETIEGLDKQGRVTDSAVAVCRATRLDSNGKPLQTHEFRFSVADAKDAGLWGKGGPWKQYPKRMLQLRARGFCLRDTFADLLMGFEVAELHGGGEEGSPVNEAARDANDRINDLIRSHADGVAHAEQDAPADADVSFTDEDIDAALGEPEDEGPPDSMFPNSPTTVH